MNNNIVKISNGNIKLGGIPNINLPPIVTCETGVPCSNDRCYAMKAYRQYPNVRNAWNHNLNMYTSDFNFYFQNILDQLKNKRNLHRFRWHSSGDIVD